MQLHTWVAVPDEPALREPTQALRQGQYAQALELLRARPQEQRETPDMLYATALACLLLGKEPEAFALLGQALARRPHGEPQQLWELLLRRRALTHEVGAQPRRSTPQAVDPPPLRCSTVERQPLGDMRWTRGLSPSLDAALLADCHPAECAQPRRRCSIESYHVYWFNGLLSPRFRPGANDLDHKLNHDGTARRMWSYFSDHAHRYTWCVYRVDK